MEKESRFLHRKMAMKTILCVEDHQDYQFLISRVLKDYTVLVAPTIKEAREMLERQPVQLILLDMVLPDGDGLKFFSMIQSEDAYKHIPVIFLSSTTEVANKVMAFTLGAEDYITKPVDPAELKARVTARLKRSEESSTSSEVIRIQNLTIDVNQQRAYIQSSQGQDPIDLTPKEFRILKILAQNLDRVFSRDQLLDKVWGMGTHVVDRTVDTHISNLRKKLNGTRLTLTSIVGEGYRLSVSPNGGA
jgi:two-component system alkaline phosphatase synthesis response regulator PhoP